MSNYKISFNSEEGWVFVDSDDHGCPNHRWIAQMDMAKPEEILKAYALTAIANELAHIARAIEAPAKPVVDINDAMWLVLIELHKHLIRKNESSMSYRQLVVATELSRGALEEALEHLIKAHYVATFVLNDEQHYRALKQ